MLGMEGAIGGYPIGSFWPDVNDARTYNPPKYITSSKWLGETKKAGSSEARKNTS